MVESRKQEEEKEDSKDLVCRPLGTSVWKLLRFHLGVLGFPIALPSHFRMLSSVRKPRDVQAILRSKKRTKEEYRDSQK
jgi:hypothetical protein